MKLEPVPVVPLIDKLVSKSILQSMGFLYLKCLHILKMETKVNIC